MITILKLYLRMNVKQNNILTFDISININRYQLECQHKSFRRISNCLHYDDPKVLRRDLIKIPSIFGHYMPFCVPNSAYLCKNQF